MRNSLSHSCMPTVALSAWLFSCGNDTRVPELEGGVTAPDAENGSIADAATTPMSTNDASTPGSGSDAATPTTVADGSVTFVPCRELFIEGETLQMVTGTSSEVALDHYKIVSPEIPSVYLECTPSGDQSAEDIYFGYRGTYDVRRAVISTARFETVWCAGEDGGSTFEFVPDAPSGGARKYLTLPEAMKLGGCPGTPVTGSIDYLGAMDPPSFSGMLGGVAVPGKPGGVSGGERSYTFSFSDGAYAILEPARDGSQSFLGLYISALDGPFAGAIFCAGPGSHYEYGNGRMNLSFQSVSRLPACEAGSTRITGCLL